MIALPLKTPIKAQDPIKQNTEFSETVSFADQSFVFNKLPDELVFTEGVSGFSCDAIYGSLFHLLFDGTIKHEQGLPSTLLKRQVTDDRNVVNS